MPPEPPALVLVSVPVAAPVPVPVTPPALVLAPSVVAVLVVLLAPPEPVVVPVPPTVPLLVTLDPMTLLLLLALLDVEEVTLFAVAWLLDSVEPLASFVPVVVGPIEPPSLPELPESEHPAAKAETM